MLSNGKCLIEPAENACELAFPIRGLAGWLLKVEQCLVSVRTNFDELESSACRPELSHEEENRAGQFCKRAVQAHSV